MFKRHPWFCFYTYGIGLVALIIASIISGILKSTNALFITSLVASLIYLFLFITFVNEGVRKKFNEKDNKNGKDYQYLILIAFAFSLLMVITIIIISSITGR